MNDDFKKRFDARRHEIDRQAKARRRTLTFLGWLVLAAMVGCGSFTMWAVVRLLQILEGM